MPRTRPLPCASPAMRWKPVCLLLPRTRPLPCVPCHGCQGGGGHFSISTSVNGSYLPFFISRMHVPLSRACTVCHMPEEYSQPHSPLQALLQTNPCTSPNHRNTPPGASPLKHTIVSEVSWCLCIGSVLPGSIAFSILCESSVTESLRSRFILNLSEALALAVKSSNIACDISILFSIPLQTPLHSYIQPDIHDKQQIPR